MKRIKREKGFGPNIKSQLIVGFMMPILFVMAVGKFSYDKAKESLIQNYEEATLSSIAMGSSYLDFGFGLTVSDTLQFTLDSSLADYAYGNYSNDLVKSNTTFNKLQSSIMIKETSNFFTDSIHIVPKKTGKLMSTDGKLGNGFFEEWVESEEAKEILNSGSHFKWVGTHPFMDEKNNISGEEYALSYMGILSNKAAVVVIDISKEAILESLEELNLGEGSVAAFITEDGKQLTYQWGEPEAGNLSFEEQDFFISCMEKGEENGSEYITYEGKEYFFLYSKSKINGSAICALVPRTIVISGAEDIRKGTVLVVIFACGVVALLALGISINISMGIRRIINKLQKVSDGDLTVELSTRGKSELSRLAKSIMIVIQNTGNLIRKVEKTLEEVQSSTGKVAVVSEQILENSEDISGAVKDIDDGLTNQADNVQDCAIMMEQLSTKIEDMTESVGEAEHLADATKQMIQEGISTIDELSNCSESTSILTGRVQDSIGELDTETIKIRQFVDVIHHISKQTNLLSLNASIEAARAGAAGKGFAVVADEIQKLAEESMNAAKEIEKIVGLIQIRTKDTVSEAENAKKMVDKQTKTVAKTQIVFDNIEEYTGKLLQKLSDISDNVGRADEERRTTMTAIDGISAVSVETAASSSVVNKTVEGQMETIEVLTSAAEELSHNMKELTDALAAFKV